MKSKDTPLLILLLFTLSYSIIGDPSNEIWSGSYFIVNYVIMFYLFSKERSRANRIIGMSLSVSILIIVVLKYFLNINYDRYYNFIPFILSLIGIYKLETK